MRRIMLVCGLFVLTSLVVACGSGDDGSEPSGAVDARLAQAIQTSVGPGIERQMAMMLRDRGVRLRQFICRPSGTEVMCEVRAVDSAGRRGTVGVSVVVVNEADGRVEGRFTGASNPAWARALQVAARGG